MTSFAERSEAISLALAAALPKDEDADVVIAAISRMCAGCIHTLPQSVQKAKLKGLLFLIEFDCASAQDRERAILGLVATVTRAGRG